MTYYEGASLYRVSYIAGGWSEEGTNQHPNKRDDSFLR